LQSELVAKRQAKPVRIEMEITAVNRSLQLLRQQADWLQLLIVLWVALVVLVFLVETQLVQDLRRQVVVVEPTRQEVALMVARALTRIFLVLHLCMDQVVQEEMAVDSEALPKVVDEDQAVFQLQTVAAAVQMSALVGLRAQPVL
jgi:hypothetical protein